mmetsp:Transcript_27301/g.49081  ORF Transcript_27301/g.49081 Transcript_27301/m.49081 type:complete len:200 (+) Transcript_27301:1322-1921(+)
MEVSLIHKLSEIALTHNYPNLLQECEQVQLDDQQSREFYVFHLFACFLNNQAHLAKMLWKRIPEKYREDKQTNSEIKQAWRLGKDLFQRNYAQVYHDIDSFHWNTPAIVQEFRRHFVKRMTHLIATAYKTLSVAEASALLGMNADSIADYSRRQGWVIEGNYLKPVGAVQAATKEFTPESMENLTRLMVYLERRTSYAK